MGVWRSSGFFCVIWVALALFFTFLFLRLFILRFISLLVFSVVLVLGGLSFWGTVVPRAFFGFCGWLLVSVLGLFALLLAFFSLRLLLVWCSWVLFLCGLVGLGDMCCLGLLFCVLLCVFLGWAVC
ncbi:hypothetical protein SK79_01210 [Escherichia coli]|nr:hypothetical protein SK79_01210 [Escherichia coli]